LGVGPLPLLIQFQYVSSDFTAQPVLTNWPIFTVFMVPQCLNQQIIWCKQRLCEDLFPQYLKPCGSIITYPVGC
ncbi:hypothetical protein XENOCAPTIV_023407, partial [Xenoophorus captivus]